MCQQPLQKLSNTCPYPSLFVSYTVLSLSDLSSGGWSNVFGDKGGGDCIADNKIVLSIKYQL